MAEMFDLDKCQDYVSVLDPGAGTGILSVAFIEKILLIHPKIKVSLT